MDESSTVPEMLQPSEENESIVQEIDEASRQAKNISNKIPSSSQTSWIDLYYMEAKGFPLKRPCLKKPSKTTADLVHEIFKDFINSNGQINVELIKKKFAQCPPEEDLLLIEDEDHNNLFHKAVILGDVQLVKILIDHGCDVNGIKSEEVCGRGLEHCPHDHLGALHLASFLGHLDVVSYLLDKGADPSLQMKVYTSAVPKGTARLPQDVQGEGYPSEERDIISECGRREAPFYAVLQNNVPILKVLLQRDIGQDDGDTASNRYLQHFACDIGNYESFEYLVGKFSWDIEDCLDGGSLMLKALCTDLRFAKLLLEHNCYLFGYNEFFSAEYNILNLIFQWDEVIRGLKTPEGLSHIVKILLKKGVDINRKGGPPFHSTPLHDLVETLNSVPDIEGPAGRENFCLFLRKLDRELIDCIQLLVDHGADLLIRDNCDKTAFQMLLQNTCHMLRYRITKDESLPDAVIQALKSGAYGLENTIKVFEIFFAGGATDKNTNLPIVEYFVDLLCYDSYDTTPGRTLRIEFLKEDSVFESYKELLRIILDAGADLNINEFSKSPLFRILSHIGKLPHALGNIIDFEFAQRMSAFMSIFLSHGAPTEVQCAAFLYCMKGIQVSPVDIKRFSCFDMLIHSLANLRDNPLAAKSLQILHLLVTLVLQHGASACVFQNILYNIPESTEEIARENELHPRHTFFFQYLMFGMFNLAYVNDGPWYFQLFNVLYSQIDHHNLYKVLGLVTTEFSRAHSTRDCVCGQCDLFSELLESVADTPRTLKKLAHLVIYNSLKDSLEIKVNELPLPNTLKTYIMTFED